MSKVYRITPLEKKSVVYHVEMFRENADGSISWVNIDETYRWGQGFIEEDMDCNLPYKDSDLAYCDPSAGWGAELDDSCACWFEYSDDFTDEDKEAFETAYHEGGAAWLFDGEHDWQEEDSAIHVLAPFKVDLCNNDGIIVEENVVLKDRPKPSTSWPFSPAFPKPDSEGGETD
jgi:hypothetical protein